MNEMWLSDLEMLVADDMAELGFSPYNKADIALYWELYFS